MRAWLLVASVILAVQPVRAQSVLPARFGAWEAVPGSGSAVSLRQLPPAQAALLRDCHEQTAERQSYQRDGAKIDVSLYWMGDPSWAYSAYSVMRPVPATGFRPTPHASFGKDRGMMLVGNLLIDVSGTNVAADAQDFVALAEALKPHASQEPYPTLWQYLPTERLAPHSDRYALDPQTLAQALAETGGKAWASGDWLGFDDDVEAEVGRYDVAGRPMTLLLASYPTQQLAAEHVKNMGQWFDINPAPGAPTKLPVLYARRIGSLVGFVSGATGAEQANKLLSQIRYQTIVTWNEPGFKLKDLTMPQYLVGIIFGTVTIILIVLVAGIALGMIRIGIKRALPGLIFDRRRSIEIIQLGLTTKPIDPSDFY